MANYTLTFGTYTFSNRTFEIQGHKQKFDTPDSDIRRKDGGVTLDGYEASRAIRINGILYSEDKDSLHNDLNTMIRAIRNQGEESALNYRADRYITARIAKQGFDFKYQKGLYEHMYKVAINMVAGNPYAEGSTLRNVAGTINNTTAVVAVTNNGSRPTRPLFTFVGGASFTNDLRVDVPGNSHYFSYSGGLLNGQSLIVDCDAGSVLLQSGITFVDAISHFGGYMFLEVPEGGAQNVIINCATLNYSIDSRDRFDA